MEDKGYCVYLHRRSDTNEIIYVGEGRLARAKSCSQSSRVNKDYQAIASRVKLYPEIYKSDLTKSEAQDLEERLIAELRESGVALVNKKDKSSNAKRLLGKDFVDKFIVDETSPSGLRWRVDRFTGFGRVIAYSGDVVGCKVSTGYWKQGNMACHRIVYAMVHGECPATLSVDHIDNDKSNNSASNLQLMSISDNAKKSHVNKKYPTGDESSSKLTKEQVLKIYKLFEDLKSDTEISEHFNVRSFTITRLRKGERWSDLYKEYGKIFPKTTRARTCSADKVKIVLHLISLTKDNNLIHQITNVPVRTIKALRKGCTLSEMVRGIDQKLKAESSAVVNQ